MTHNTSKVAIVTGAAKGIGRAIAKRLAGSGVRVALADIDEASGEEAVDEIRRHGGTAVFLAGDVTQASDVKRCVANTLEAYGGRLDIVVNNAGGLTAPRAGSEQFLEMPLEVWEADIRLNLTAPFMLAQAAIPVMSQRGVVINISSLNAHRAIDSVAYTCGKAGVEALTRYVAAFCGNRVRAVALVLGTIATETVLRLWDDRRGGMPQLEQWIPVGEVPPPEAVAEFVAFLASDAARFCNGASYFLDGGSGIDLHNYGKEVS
jgi:NAD(P)-dependent dehydrogenase (short-subunit alcohol dehydrogenase family)